MRTRTPHRVAFYLYRTAGSGYRSLPVLRFTRLRAVYARLPHCTFTACCVPLLPRFSYVPHYAYLRLSSCTAFVVGLVTCCWLLHSFGSRTHALRWLVLTTGSPFGCYVTLRVHLLRYIPCVHARMRCLRLPHTGYGYVVACLHTRLRFRSRTAGSRTTTLPRIFRTTPSLPTGFLRARLLRGSHPHTVGCYAHAYCAVVPAFVRFTRVCRGSGSHFAVHAVTARTGYRVRARTRGLVGLRFCYTTAHRLPFSALRFLQPHTQFTVWLGLLRTLLVTTARFTYTGLRTRSALPQFCLYGYRLPAGLPRFHMRLPPACYCGLRFAPFTTLLRLPYLPFGSLLHAWFIATVLPAGWCVHYRGYYITRFILPLPHGYAHRLGYGLYGYITTTTAFTARLPQVAGYVYFTHLRLVAARLHTRTFATRLHRCGCHRCGVAHAHVCYTVAARTRAVTIGCGSTHLLPHGYCRSSSRLDAVTARFTWFFGSSYLFPAFCVVVYAAHTRLPRVLVAARFHCARCRSGSRFATCHAVTGYVAHTHIAFIFYTVACGLVLPGCYLPHRFAWLRYILRLLPVPVRTLPFCRYGYWFTHGSVYHLPTVLPCSSGLLPFTAFTRYYTTRTVTGSYRRRFTLRLRLPPLPAIPAGSLPFTLHCLPAGYGWVIHTFVTTLLRLRLRLHGCYTQFALPLQFCRYTLPHVTFGCYVTFTLRSGYAFTRYTCRSYTTGYSSVGFVLYLPRRLHLPVRTFATPRLHGLPHIYHTVRIHLPLPAVLRFAFYTAHTVYTPHVAVRAAVCTHTRTHGLLPAQFGWFLRSAFWLQLPHFTHLVRVTLRCRGCVCWLLLLQLQLLHGLHCRCRITVPRTFLFFTVHGYLVTVYTLVLRLLVTWRSTTCHHHCYRVTAVLRFTLPRCLPYRTRVTVYRGSLCPFGSRVATVLGSAGYALPFAGYSSYRRGSFGSGCYGCPQLIHPGWMRLLVTCYTYYSSAVTLHGYTRSGYHALPLRFLPFVRTLYHFFFLRYA